MEKNCEITEVITFFKYLEICSNKDGGPHEDVKTRVGAMKMMFYVRSASLGGLKELFETAAVPAVMFVAETCSIRIDETRKLDVLDMKYV